MKAADVVDLPGVAEMLDASPNTVKQWRKRYPEYFEPVPADELPELLRSVRRPFFRRSDIRRFAALDRRPGRPKVSTE